MKTVSMLDFRKNAERIIAQVQKGQRMILTCRGKPVARLEPIVNETAQGDDPFYTLSELSAGGGESLTNTQIDNIVYGQ
jgi:prevent-host-death family protein